jgi:hypothetical protein
MELYKNDFTNKNYINNNYINNNYINNNYINNINIIIVGTHNNRLECFFSKYHPGLDNKYFKNCAIIKCYNLNGKLTFNMIYSGDNIEKDNNMCDSLCWNAINFNKYFNNININYSFIIPSDTEIYLVRHGQGYHNIKGTINKILNNTIVDPELTDVGINQAILAGTFLNGYIKTYYKNPNIKFGASHLIRTQQTIGFMMTQFNRNDTIYIIPCIHELIYNNNGNCDNSLLNKLPINSNKPKCNYNTLNTTCYNLKITTNNMNINININWDYYIKFYKLNNTCENTNIINEILII